jgi:hypothetical protein
MKRTILAAVLLAGTAMTSPASAVTFDSIGDTSGAILFNGIIEGVVQPGLTASITYSVVSINTATNDWTISYSVTNTSSDPVTASRVSTFGFNTDPNLVPFDGPQDTGTTRILTGSAYLGVDAGNVAQLGSVEFCATDLNGTCSGGGNGGTLIGATSTGTFLLDFAAGNPLTSITLDDFTVRYQSIAGVCNGCSGSGVQAVPGPIVGAGIPGLIAALGGMYGLNFYRRRRNGSLPA